MKTLREIVDVAVRDVDAPDQLPRVLTAPENGDGTYLVRDGSGWRFYDRERGSRHREVKTATVTAAARYLLASHYDRVAPLLPDDTELRALAQELCIVRASLDSRRSAWRLDDRSLTVPSPDGRESVAIGFVASALEQEPTSVRPVEGSSARVECRLATDADPTSAIERLRDAFVLPVAIVETDDGERVLPAPDVRRE